MKKLIGIVWLLLMCMTMSLCSVNAEEPVCIGLSAPLTGQYQEYGNNFKKAIELGIEWINEAGGINGRPLELVVGDSEGLPQKAKTVARQFTKDTRIAATLGDFTSTCSMAAQPIYQRAEMVQLSPSSSHPSYAPGSPYSFGIVGTQSEDGPAMARQAVQTLKKKKIAMIYINNEWGNVTQKLFSEEVERLGAEMAAAESYLEGTTDFTSLLESVRSAKPELLFLCSMYQDASLIIKQRQELGWDDVVVMGSSALYTPKIFEVGREAVDGLYTFTAFFPKDPRLEVQQFVEAFNTRYGHTPNMFAALAYDSLNVLAEAIKQAGTDRRKIRDELAKTSGYMGLTGEITFSQYGDILKSFLLLQIKDGDFVLYSEE